MLSELLNPLYYIQYEYTRNTIASPQSIWTPNEAIDLCFFLGFIFRPKLSKTNCATFWHHSGYERISRALGVSICKSKAVGGMSYATFTKLYNSQIVPIVTILILTYGVDIRDHSRLGVLNTLQNKACIYSLG